MFTAVPPRYDLINRIITLGWDSRWRNTAARICLEDSPKRILDVGCGTGDLAIGIARLARDVTITGLDFSLPMLVRAQKKAERAGMDKRITFIHGDATALPFPDGHFDVAGISFAFRNLTYQNPNQKPHLAEVRRVLRAGGRYIIVETSQPENSLIRALFHLYLHAVAAPIGILISGQRGAYHYLAESARRFYSPAEVREILLEAGFRKVSYRPLLFGAAGIHVAIR
jgi:demethylmenaquinone methyltransferase/2-methoxy-6-polyprenyl-1,4-benzoquinol methylase